MLKVSSLNKIYPNGCHALRGVSFDVKEGEFLVVIGLSGSGKSTLLRCINRLNKISSGSVEFAGKDISSIEGTAIRKVRSQIGMIFQNFNLINRKSVLINVLTGRLSKTGILASIFGLFSDSAKKEALKYIEVVGLKGKEIARVDNLSGGQQQRVAIARALMQRPKLLLADEPVASLDPATSNSVMKYLKKVNDELGVTVICNLHFLSLVREYASKVIALKDGKIVYEGLPEDINNEWFKKIYGEDAKEVTIE